MGILTGGGERGGAREERGGGLAMGRDLGNGGGQGNRGGFSGRGRGGRGGGANIKAKDLMGRGAGGRGGAGRIRLLEGGEHPLASYSPRYFATTGRTRGKRIACNDGQRLVWRPAEDEGCG